MAARVSSRFAQARARSACRVRSIVALLAMVALLGGCTRRETLATSSELQGAAANSGFWTRDELYFGMNMPGGAIVSDSAWMSFLDREIVTRLPDGFTIFESMGYYRDRTTGRTEREPSRVLLVYYRDDQPGAARALAELAALYKRVFNQQSVLRVTSRVRATF